MIQLRHYFVFGFLVSALGACSSAPKISKTSLSDREATEWLHRYCSPGPRGIGGELVMKANTKEFKGQYPASLRIEKNGQFTLETTNILGGTILRMTSDGKTIDLLVPSKPKYNRNGITNYLGLDLSILSQLLMGDLPCPKEKSQMKIEADGWVWTFEKAVAEAQGVPVKVTLLPQGESDQKHRIELLIEEWDQEHHFAKKVTVRGPEGELKWAWRSRN